MSAPDAGRNRPGPLPRRAILAGAAGWGAAALLSACGGSSASGGNVGGITVTDQRASD